MDMKTILLDIGGTYIKRSDGRQFPALSSGSRGEVADALRKAIGPLAGVDGIGVAVPGPFDFRNGIFLMRHKYASVYGESFRALAKVPDSIPVKFHHDVNTLLLGAMKMLGLEGDDVAIVTLGTGLGFGHAVSGQVQYSPGGSPAVSLWNRPLPDGGILEDELSAGGICRAYSRASGRKCRSALSVSRMAYAGNPEALKVYEDLGARLGGVIKGLSHELSIQTLLLGGQISGSMSLMETPLRDALPGIRIMQAPENAVFEGLKSLF